MRSKPSSLLSYSRTQAPKYHVVAMLSSQAPHRAKTLLKALAEKQLMVTVRDDH